jgi:glycerol-3-phosphate dehydrogenase (NAD(P)+)
VIGILGGGAFGSALGVALARAQRPVILWARDVSGFGAEAPRLPGVPLPGGLRVTGQLADLAGAEVILAAVPMAALQDVLTQAADVVAGKSVVACCKGLDLETGQGPTALITASGARAAILSGPSFAADIARGLPTALTLAGAEAHALQQQLSTPTLRLYRSDDVVGVALGGAVKNVIAIACGAAIGAGLGESARSALMTRGFAEMQRLGAAMGARPETLMGLSGLGDLALTCASAMSRNYQYGLALGGGQSFDAAATVEGRRTAAAVARLGHDLPICATVAALCQGQTSVAEAIEALLSRPLRAE